MAKALQGSGFGWAALGPLFRRVHKLKTLIAGRLLAMRAGYGRTALGNLRSVRPKRIVKKSVGLRFNLAVAEDFLAILAIQSPLRHSVTFWRGVVLASLIMPNSRYGKCSKRDTAACSLRDSFIGRLSTFWRYGKSKETFRKVNRRVKS